jgi:hypothetical protein
MLHKDVINLNLFFGCVNQSFHFNEDSFIGDSLSLFKKNGDLSFFNKIMLKDNNWSFIEMEIGMSLSVWFDE